MLIRKKYKFEAAHKVRNCASNRCSKNIHGHSFIVEVILHSDFLDDGDMVIDFGLLRATVGEFIDWFDHSLLVWDKDAEMVEIAEKANERICVLPFNTTAENLSKAMFMAIWNIFESTKFTNGEAGVSVHTIRVHETATGYAECGYGDITADDWKKLPGLYFSHIDETNFIIRLIREQQTYISPMEILG